MLRLLWFSEEVTSPQKYWSADPRRGEGTKASNNLGIGITIKMPESAGNTVSIRENIGPLYDVRYISQNNL